MDATGNAGGDNLRGEPRKVSTRRTFVFGATAALGALGAAACGRADSSAAPLVTQAAPVTGSGGAAAVTATSSAEAGGQLTQSGFVCTAARMLWVTVPISDSPPAWMIPPGLPLSSPALATFFIAHYPLTSFDTVYNEAAVLLHVDGDSGPAWHCPWIVVDDDTALILGREMTGYPKKMAQITLEEGSDSIVGTVVRKGQQVMQISAETKTLVESGGGAWTSPLINAQGSFIEGMRLLKFPLYSEQVHSRRVGQATTTLTSSDRDPLGSLVSQPSQSDAAFVVVDFGKTADAGAFTGGALPLDWTWTRQVGTSI